MISILKKRWVYHSLIWLTFGIVLFMIIRSDANSKNISEAIYLVIGIFIPLTFAVYGHFYIKKNLLDKRKYLLYCGSLLVLILTSSLMTEGFKLLGIGIDSSYSQNLLNISSVVILTTGFQYFKRGFVNQYFFQELKARNSETELQLLKAQLNPHFLFNTLNNIYSVNQIEPDKGSEMILELSDVMRYHLESSKFKFISLGEEVKFIRSYIELEKLRLSKASVLEVEMDKLDPSIRIPPLLFIPFIENAFKHGTHPTKPNTINLKLTSDGKSVYFNIENTIITDKNAVKTHVGLENTRRRLALIYPENHELTISNDGLTFKIALKIDL